MTSLLWALDFFKEQVLENKINKVKLMFDEDNPTNEEEILEQALEQVILKPDVSFAEMC